MDANSGAYESIHLDRLVHFEMDTYLVGAALLLWRLRMHPEARTTLTLDAQRPVPPAHLEQACLIMRKRHAAPHNGFQTIQVSDFVGPNRDTLVTLSAWRDDAPQHLLHDFDLGHVECHPPDFQITFTCDLSFRPILQLEDIVNIVSLDGVRNLSLQAAPTLYGHQYAVWDAIFHALPQFNLTWLRLDGYSAHAFIVNEDALQGHVLPRLQTLTLFGVPWKPHWAAGPDYRQSLARLLKSREASDTPVSELLVEDNDIHTMALVGVLGQDVVHVLEPVDEMSARALAARWS
ncbi:unnamed protein product [Peniophora sp. CBMAI 1063]|nr:unnamed protein product [Peniophora sp. CBMAI 1063]